MARFPLPTGYRQAIVDDFARAAAWNAAFAEHRAEQVRACESCDGTGWQAECSHCIASEAVACAYCNPDGSYIPVAGGAVITDDAATRELLLAEAQADWWEDFPFDSSQWQDDAVGYQRVRCAVCGDSGVPCAECGHAIRPARGGILFAHWPHIVDQW